MKVQIELPDYIIETVQGLLMMQADSETEADHIKQAVARIKEKKDEPLQLEMNGKKSIFGVGDSKDAKQMLVAIGAFAVAQEIKDMEGK